MEFIQLNSIPSASIPTLDGLCIGIKVPVPNYGHFESQQERVDLYKFRDHLNSNQNGYVGWFCANANKTTFKLMLKF